MATLQEQLDALREARASGLRKVKYGEREMEYRTDEELAAAIADLERRIAQQSGAAVHTIRIYSSKGF